VFAFFREDLGYAENLEGVGPFVLIAHSGVAKTPFGSIGFIVWKIAAGEPQEVFVEQYLNPAQKGALALVSDASDQSHFKFVAINRDTGDVTVLVQFENVFGFNELHKAMVLAHRIDCCTNFIDATKYVKQNYTLPELITFAALT
jgi:hypothetical protein